MGMQGSKYLVAGYPFEGTCADVMGANNGTPTNITYVNGIYGKAASFNGTSSFITIADNPNLSFTDGTNDKPFSISMWIKFNSTANQWIINKRSPTSSEYQLVYYSGLLSLYLFSNNNSSVYIQKFVPFTPQANVAYHIVATYDGSGLATGIIISINLSKNSAATGSGGYVKMTNTPSTVIVGKAGFSDAFYFTGIIENLKIYNKALTQAEIQRDYLNLPIF